MPAQRSSGTASLPTAPRMDRAPVEIKPQKACVNCRRSKVKCVHEGGPPCKRCTNNKVECKFRLRADDEDWRDWTDDRINTLNNKVDQIISRGSSMGPTPTPGPPSPSFSHLSRSMSIGGSGSSLNLPPIGSMTQQGGNGLPPPSSWSNSQASPSRGVTTMRAPSARGAMEAPSPQMNSPQSMLPHRPRSSTGGSSSAPAPPLPQPYGVGTNTAASPRSSNATFVPFPHAHQSTAQTYGSPQLRPPTHFPSHPNAITNGNQQGGDTSMERGGEEGGPAGAEGSDHKSPASARSNEDSRMRTGDDNHHAGPPPPSEIFASQIPSPPLLSQLFALSSPSRPLVLPPRATSHRWATGKGTYANANMLIGREDPRLNAISMGIVPMARARALMVFFADHLQPHSFGFPSFPANEQMTPLIISSLLMVASAHEPSSTHFYSPLLAEVLSSVKPEEEVSEEKPLDPELGIGVEEITGACIAASWMGGENGWKIARVARWWAIGYLSNFDLPNPRSVTLGECLQILPTFRSIDQVDKMRIWLMAYCTEAQQSYMHDRPVLTPGVSPDPYIQALRAAFAEGRVIDSQTGLEHHNSPRGAGSSIGKVPEADRMLTAHAGLMFILTSARSRLREMRWRWGREREREREREIAGHHPLGVEELRATQIAEGDELRNAWKSWIAELDIFWIDAGVWEDLSAPTTSALDLSLCNHLVRALLGSLALDFPEPNHQHGRSHSHPLSPAVGGGGGPSPSGSGGYVHESPHSHPTPGGSGANHQNSGPFLHARAPSHVSFSAHPNPNMSPTLQLAQVEMVRTGKDAAVRALRAVCGNGEFRGEWRERLGWLPGWYHFLLAHSASFLLILLHRRSTFLSAGEVDSIYTLMSNFTQLYLFAIQSHSIVGSETESGPHPALVTAEGLVRGMRGIVPSLNE